MSYLLTNGRFQAFDASGNPLVGGSLYTYFAGTTNPQNTFTDAALMVPNANPTVLNARGEAVVFLGPNAYSMTLKDANGVTVWSLDGVVDPSAAGAAAVAALAQTSGAGQIGFDQTLNYVARTIGASLIDRGVDLMNFVTSQVERAAIKAGTSTADHSADFNAALILAKRVFVSEGGWRLQSTVTVPTGHSLEGAGIGATAINAYGCDAFKIAAGASLIAITKLAIFSFTALGAADPRTFDAILCTGVSGNTINYVTSRDLYIQGFADAINWQFTWNSTVDNITTVNCNFGVQVIGQSVNNNVRASRLIVNGGTASVHTAQSGAGIPEGLTISDTLMSSGNYGLQTDGSFLSLQMVNCILDLIAIDAIHSTDSKELHVTNCWMYAAAGCVRLMALGSAASEGAELFTNVLHLTGSSGRVIEQQGANIGLGVAGNHLIFGGTAVGIWLDGQAAAIDLNHFENSGSGADVVINSSPTTHRIGSANTKSTGALITVIGGFAAPQYSEGNWTVTDQSGAGLTIANTSQATYTKIGKLVTCALDITYPATANGTTARLSLPFQTDTVPAVAGCIALQQTVTVPLQPNGTAAASNFVFWKPATQAFATNADLTGAHLIVSFTYRAIS